MKYLFSLILLVSFTTAIPAQTTTEEQNLLEEQIALIRQSAHTDRKIIIMGNYELYCRGKRPILAGVERIPRSTGGQWRPDAGLDQGFCRKLRKYDK